MARAPARVLTLFDSTCIIVGIIIGAGIYETAPAVAASVQGWPGLLGVWLAGGLIALTGALCYAELASAWPQSGGDYVYLKRAYGLWAGYLFGWSQMVIIRPGDIALLAFVFGRYASTLFAPFEGCRTAYAAGAVAVLTLINIAGLKQGKWTQNLLTVLKAAGLLAIVAAGLAAPGVSNAAADAAPLGLSGIQLALILVLFTYGGWSEMAYVAAEVKDPDRNIVRGLVLGAASVTALYLLVNVAFLKALGWAGMADSEAVAVDTLATIFPNAAAKAIAVLICLSALGAVNGLVLTGGRISYALGQGHVAFERLGRWHPRFGTPVMALVLQGALSLAIVLVAGSFIDTLLYTAPVAWLFFLATGLSLFVLRRREPGARRPYRVAAYPVTPLLFCGACLFMLYSAVTYALTQQRFGLFLVCGVFATGVVVYVATRGRTAAVDREDKERSGM